MFFEGNKLFTIGQFATLHEINKKTLMWYDEIGLLKPACIQENGYRYYTYQQSFTLEIILMLRELNISTSEIRGFLEHRSAAALETLLGEKLAELDQTISHLMAIKKVMADRRQDMVTLRGLDLSDIQIITKKEPHYFVTVDISQGLPFESELELVVRAAKDYQLHRLRDATYGAMLPVDRLYAKEFDRYSDLYLELPFPTHKTGLHVQPPGAYLRAFCQGNWERLPHRYQEILAYAEARHLRFSGFAYEKGLNEIVLDTMDDYITQIELPIQTK